MSKSFEFERWRADKHYWVSGILKMAEKSMGHGTVGILLHGFFSKSTLGNTVGQQHGIDRYSAGTSLITESATPCVSGDVTG